MFLVDGRTVKVCWMHNNKPSCC